jgi:hypothetical protein
VTGPLEIVGAGEAPVCEDGVCAVPGAEVDLPDDEDAQSR